MAEPLNEFDQIVASMESGDAEAVIQEQWRKEWLQYSHEDPEFRAIIISKIVELTGVKTGEELFSDGEA